MTEAQSAKLFAVMAAAYPNAKGDEATAAVYRRMLADLDYAVANAAVEGLLATSKWLPTVAEIREACASLEQGDRKPGGEAWGMVLSAIGRYGSYRVPGKDFQFPDAVVAKCVDALGWRELCLSENIHADRARFVELYDQLAVTERRKQLAEGLPALKRLREARPELPAGRNHAGTSAGDAIRNVLRLIPGGGGES